MDNETTRIEEPNYRAVFSGGPNDGWICYLEKPYDEVYLRAETPSGRVKMTYQLHYSDGFRLEYRMTREEPTTEEVGLSFSLQRP